MKFGISITIDEKADHKSHLIISLSEALKEYFQDKNYGEDIKDYIIGTGEEHIMNKLFINRFNFNPDEYEEFISVSDEESKKILENKIIESLENLDKLPKKVKDFDKARFKNDLLTFLNSNLPNI